MRPSARLYELFPILQARGNQMANTLSGGEQQMLAIARALMAGPKLLLCDEISLGLAPVIIKDIYKRLTQINQEGLTIVLVEQDIRRSLKASHYTYVMLEGKVVLEGEPSSLSEESGEEGVFRDLSPRRTGGKRGTRSAEGGMSFPASRG